MTDNINTWFAAHNPDLSGPKGIHGTASNADIINAAMGFSGNRVISMASLTGEDTQQALSADKKADALYKTDGAAAAGFIAAFAEAPTTGLATLLDMARLRGNFAPADGKDALSSFNQYMQGVGSCPFLNLSRNNSSKYTKELTSQTDLSECIIDTLSYDSKALEKQIMLAIPTEQAQTVKLDIYIMRLTAGTQPTFQVNAAAMSITYKREKKKSHDRTKTDDSKKDNYTDNYNLSSNGYMLLFSMQPGVWGKSVAQKVASQHFCTIEDWVRNSSNFQA